MAHKDHIHQKISKDSTLCGGSVFGVLTNAEGRKVNCPGCLDRMGDTKYIHRFNPDNHKTVCGGSPHGVTLEAPGISADCPECLEAPTRIAIKCVKEINTQPYLEVSIGGKPFAEVYPCEAAWKVEDGLLDLNKVPDWFRNFYEHMVQQPGIKSYLED